MGAKYDLEQRTFEFSKRILNMLAALPKTPNNRHFADQCLRSSTSVGANYREANDALGAKDFLHRIRISRKEAKETIYWIRLIIEQNSKLEPRIKSLLQESIELKNILSAIIIKKEKK